MRHVLLFLILACPVHIHAQSFEQWTAWGDAAFERGEYYGATRFYDGALAVDPGRLSVQWKQAEACRLSHQYDKAAALYEKVQRKDMGRTHPEALRWLAEMRMCMGDYREAMTTWRKVLQKEKDKSSFVAQRAENGIAGCEIALDSTMITGRPVVKMEHLPQPINTYDSEFGARIGPDSMLYFASLRGELNKDGEVEDTSAYRTGLFRAARTTPWAQPQPVSSINSTGQNANATWSVDGTWFLFTRCEPGMPCRIHIAPVHADGNLGDARVLPGIGDDLMSTQPMAVHWADRDMLLFVSDRQGGEGGTDIWQGELHGGEVKFIYPLGQPVNTPGDERCPWYDHVTNSLWYSSDFLPGYGGYDIFSAAFGNDVFSLPVNAGTPINSPANDLYPVHDPLRGEGWITSNRKGSFAAKGETCCNDLYRFSIGPVAPRPVVNDTVLVTEEAIRAQTAPERLLAMQERFPLRLYFHNDDPDPRSWETSTPQTYGETYARYKALEWEYERENPDPAHIHRFFVEQVDHGYKELGELAQAIWPVLSEGRSVVLEVRGHASPLARNDYNRNLSMRRIESLRNHLRAVDNGRLAPYLTQVASNGATLTIRELPFGEDRSATGVSDELADLRRSVYSVEASSERRIEIEAIGLEQRETSETGERLVLDLGPLTMNKEREARFTLVNTGRKAMLLLRARAECGCTTAELPTGSIAPGGSQEIVVTFSGRAPLGPLSRNVVVETDGTPARFELELRGTVVP
jgi:Protein of unknown function (DUF1573)/WD40-like Beta Propeller Repeat